MVAVSQAKNPAWKEDKKKIRHSVHFKSSQERFEALIKTSFSSQESHSKPFSTAALPRPRQKNAPWAPDPARRWKTQLGEKVW